MIIYIFIFLFSLCISFFLLEELSFYIFIKKYYFHIFSAGIVYFIPKILAPSLDCFLLDIGFCITILTDIIDYSVFSIIPIILILYSILFSFLYGNYDILLNNIFNSIVIYSVFLLLSFLIKKIFNKDGIGIGDLYFYFILTWYFNLFFLLISFFIASLLGLFFILLEKLIFFNKPLRKMIPFIPFLYMSILLLQIQSIYNYLVAFLLI